MDRSMLIAIGGLLILIIIIALVGCPGTSGVANYCIEENAEKAMRPVEEFLLENDIFEEYNDEVYQCFLEQLVASWESDGYSCEYLATMEDAWTVAAVWGAVNKKKFKHDLTICIAEKVGVQEEHVISILNIFFPRE